MTGGAAHPVDAARSPAALRSFGLLAGLHLPLVWSVAALLGIGGEAILPALMVYAAGMGWAALLLRRDYPHSRLGLCNMVTQARAALGAVLVAALFGPDPAGPVLWVLLGLALLSLAMDGVDGWLARRSGLTSEFGARFDMEVDAALGLVLALLAYQEGKAGLWVLGLGIMRYLFLGAAQLWPWLGAPLPDSLRRKAVCVIQIAALIALIAPPVQPPLSVWIALPAVLLLAWSFATDILWLARRR